MNRHRYHVIFNAARGLWMAVQETATSFGKGRVAGRAGRSDGRTEVPARAALRSVVRGAVVAVIGAWAIQPVVSFAQVSAAPTAPAANRPAVGQAPNGVPLVQITTPNAAGVSNNVFSQYNVGQNGLILNNSPSTTQTQLGGYVAGNPYLANGSAHVIVNQVVGGNPSQLLGYTEVAGARAEVVIANPSGIYCNGCGFINATRTVLTTGMPVFGGSGSLDAFHVTGGQIQIGSAGFNGSNIDQVDLIARSVQINGKLWAGKQLNVVTGANDVAHGDLSTKALAADGNSPAVAIDVSHLGGMYAGKITLVGTEAGVGVNSLGTIQAQAGDVQLSNAGKVTLAGSTSASGNAQIQAVGDVSNSGQIYASQSASVSSQGSVSNSGTVAALGNTTISGAGIVSTGALGAGIDSSGHVGGTGSLAIEASGAVASTAQNLAGGNLEVKGSSLNLAGSQTLVNGSASLRATGAGGDTGNVNQAHAAVSVAGALDVSAAGALTTEQAQVSAGQLAVTAASLSNRAGQLQQTGAGKGTFAVAGDIDNTQGTIQFAGAASLAAYNITNAAGRIVSLDSDGLTLDASGAIGNTSGTTAQGTAGGVIGGNGNVTVHSSSLTNTGTVTAGQALDATVTGLLDNSAGTMTGTTVTANSGSLKNASGAISGSTVSLTIPQLDNSGGQITANQLTVGSTNLTNEHGTLTQLGTGPASMAVSNAIDNSNGGVIQTNSQDLMLTPASLNNNGGTITHAGTGTLTIDAGNGAGTLMNVGGAVTSNGAIEMAAAGVANSDGTVVAAKALTVTTGGNVDNTRGTIQAGGAASLTAANVTNAAGRIVSLNSDGLTLTASGAIGNTSGTTAQGTAGGVIGGNGNVTVHSSSLTNSGTVTAGQALDATAAGLLDNSAGTMNGTSVTADAGSLKNANGGAISGSTVSLTIPQLDNSGGQITANQVTVGSTSFTNEHGALTQLGTGPMSMAVSNAIDNSNGGLIQTNSQDLRLTPASLNNNGGTITHAGTGTLTIDAGNGAGTLTNVGGAVTSNGAIDVAAAGVQNAGGAIASGKALTVTTGGDVDNARGTIQAGGAASLTAANVTNAAGRIVSLNSDGLTLTASGAIGNTSGTTAQGTAAGVIGGNGNVTVHSSSLTNSGTITAGQALDATVVGLLDNSAGAMSGAAVTANAGSLKNANSGAISGSTVSLTIPQLDNSGGQIRANQVTVGSTNFTNEHGALTQLGTGPMSMAVSSAIDNSNGGVIQTNSQDLTLTPASLNNNGGTITHAGTGTLTINAANGTGALSNVAGKIIGNGAANVTAASLDDTAGTIAARGAMSVTLTGALTNNTGGLLHSDTSLVATSGSTLSNVGGRINVGTPAGASSASTLSVTAASIDNTNGSMLNVGSGATTISGTNQIVNSNAGGVSGMGSIGGNGGVKLTTAALTNTQGGQLSGANVQINTGTLNNTGGMIGNVANTSGDIGISASGVVYNGSGQISAARNLSLTADTLSGGGAYNAAGDVTLNLQGNFTNAPGYQFNAGNNLTFNLPGWFSNSGTFVTFNNLTINAGNIGNSGSITAGGLLKTSSATLTNVGAMVGASVSLNAWQSIANLGTTALIGATDSAGLLEVLAPDIENRDDSTATDTQAQTMIYGLGRVALAGGKDANGNYTKANLITNQSALIQSDGDMLLAANLVNNTRRQMSTSGFTSSVDPNLLASMGISLSGRRGQVGVADPNTIGGVYVDPPHGGQWNSTYEFTTYTGIAMASTVTAISPKSQLISGGNLYASSVDTFQNYWSQVAAAGNIAKPVNVDQQSWRGQTGPQVTVTYSGEYHYNNYDDTEHDWQLPFGDAGFVTGIPDGSYAQKAPADVRTYALPGYESTWVANGTISGVGGTINNTGGNAGVTPLGLTPGQTLATTNADTANGSVGGGSVADGSSFQAIVHGAPGNPMHLSSMSGGASSVRGSIIAPDPALGNATALPVLTNLTVPQGGLFKPDTAPNAPYLVETNPAFTNLHQWLSSDYYFQQMGMDPGMIQMRLGDGFYEQHLVQSQIMSLTGRSVLTNYADTQSEFQALMASGAALAKQLNLAPGMGLSAEQVASLTGNVVIMQTAVVDGKSVLVPVVYLAKASQENMGNGPVIAATDIDLENTQGIKNSGTIRAANSLTLTGQSIDSSFGALQSGGLTTLATVGDINLTSGTIKAGSLALNAGGNLTLDTALKTLSQVSDTGATRVTGTLGPTASIDVQGNAAIIAGGNFEQNAGVLNVGGTLGMSIGGNWNLGVQQTGETKAVERANGVSNTHFVDDTGSSVKVGGVSTIAVGGDLTATGATMKLGGGGTLAAGGDVTLQAAVATSTIDSNSSGSDHHGSYAETLHTSDDAVTATTLSGGDSLNIVSGKDINVTGSTIDLKKGKLQMAAAGDVNIGAVTETHSFNADQNSSHGGFASSTKKTDHIHETTTLADGSAISADAVSVYSGKDLNVTGSSIVGTSDVALNAKGNVNITAATSTYQDTEFHDVKHSGFSGTGGIGISYGSSETKDNYADTSVTQSQSRSTIGSVAGNVTIASGKDVHIGGSDVVAGKAKDDTTGLTGNIAIQGQNVTIDPGQDTDHMHDEQSTHSSGISVAVTGTPLDTVRNLRANASSGNGFHRAQGVMTEIGASAGETPSVSVSYGSSSSSSTTDRASLANSGSAIRGAGNVSITATGGAIKDANGAPVDGDLTVVGSTITAGGTTTLAANRDVTLQASTDQLQQSMQSSSSSTGFTLAPHTTGDWARWMAGTANSGGTSPSPYNASRSGSKGNEAQTVQTSTVVTGNSVVVQSKTGNINVIGSGISGTQGVDLVATQGAINVMAGLDTNTSHQESSSRQIGSLGSNGTATGFTVGVASSHSVQDGAEQTQSNIRSQIVSGSGSVTLDAKQDLTVAGADLSAGKDLTLIGRNVILDPGTDAMQTSMTQSSSQFGVTLALGGAAGNAIAAVNQAMDQASHTKDKRLAALDVAQAGLAVENAVKVADQFSSTGKSGQPLVKVTVSIGGGTSHSESQSSTVANDGSTLRAGGTVDIVATGSGAKDANGFATDGDITARGTQISGQDVTLNAARDINLESAKDTGEQKSSNSSSGGSIGVGFGLGGQQNGFTLELAANMAKGNANGDSVTNRDAQIAASNTLTMTSGRDANLRGGEVAGNSVDANVGRDLNVQSPQDTSKYDSKQTSGGFQASICIPPFCLGQTVSGSASVSQQMIKDNYQSVNQQSGIYAGNGGFNINVGNHTQLDGGAIASTASADKNSLSTQTLDYSNLHNEASYSGSSMGFSASVAGGKSSRDGTVSFSNPVQTSNASGGPSNSLGLGPTGFGGGGVSKSASGTTYAAVSPGTITVRGDAGTGHDSTEGLSRDTKDANGSVANTFNAQTVQDDLAIQSQTAQVGMHVAGDIAQHLEDQALDKAKAAADRLQTAKDAHDDAAAQRAQADLDAANADSKLWDDNGGAGRMGLHAIVGVVGAALGGGSVPGALGGTLAGDLASAAVSPALSGTLGGTLLTNLVSGLAGAAVGGALDGTAGAMSGANGALGADLYNRQLHPDEKQRIHDLAKGNSLEEAKLSAAACALVHCAAEYAVGSAAYNYYSQLEALGNSPDLANERNTLSQQPGLFTYTTNPYNPFSDANTDAAKQFNNTYQVTTRGLGALQAAGGAATAISGASIVAGGAVTCGETLGAGCAAATGGVAMMGWGADQTTAGLGTMISGQPQPTLGAQALQSTFGISPAASELLYGMAGLVPTAASAILANNAVNAEAAANAWARGTYTGSSSAQYAGNVYRYTLPEYSSGTWEIYPGNVAADHRYSPPGVGAVYAGTTPETAAAEVASYGALEGRVLVANNVVVNNVLDLTNPAARQALGVTLEQLTDTTHGGSSYTTTQALSAWARDQGYQAILAPSAQNPSGANLIAFKSLSGGG